MMADTLDEMERLGYEFSSHAGGVQVITPITAGDESGRVLEIERDMSRNWEAYVAAIEIRLWRREGVIK